MDMHAFIADASISVFGALGATIALHSVAQITPSDAAARSFRFCLWLLVILMVARVGHWGQLGWLFSLVTQATAACIPLAGLMIAEVLLRRHAPLILKWLCAGGALVFTVLALVTLGRFGYWQVLGLLLFQVASLLGVAWFVLTRDHDSLAQAENRAISRIGLSLFLILPFLISDFLRMPGFDIPVRLGGVAVLALCWLSISFWRTGLRQTDILRGFGVVLLSSAALTALLAVVTPVDLRAIMQVAAVLVAALLLLATWQASVALNIEDGQQVAMRAMAEPHGIGPDAGQTLLRRATGAPDAVMVHEADLADYDLTALRGGFGEAHYRHTDDNQTCEDIKWLLSAYGASHAVKLKDSPLTLVLLNNPALAAADSNGVSLAAVARMAVMISNKGAP